MVWLLPVLTLSALCSPAIAAVSVFACEPEWGALVNEIAGNRANVYVATTAMQNPHIVPARPSLIARARSEADVRSRWIHMCWWQAEHRLSPGKRAM